MKRALICGISGQDGTLLAEFLLKKGYEVFGTSRDANAAKFTNLINKKIKNELTILTMVPDDFRSVYIAIKMSSPDELYFLAGQTSVGLSFELPADTMKSITIGTLNILEACRLSGKNIKIYNAGSSESFGDTNGFAANEYQPFNPRSPYGVAKASSYWLVNNYREAYNLFACTGILFNHESDLRPERFVTQKIIKCAVRIYNGASEKLKLGRLDISRDWGWAPEYIEAIWLMMQKDYPVDLIIATGKSYTLEEFVNETFLILGLDWKEYVVQDRSLYRPTDILISKADPSKAKNEIGWEAKYDAKDVIKKMIDAEMLNNLLGN
jgi:GDPmannose 4,6-dehydratase